MYHRKSIWIMSGRSTAKVIFLLQQLIEKYGEKTRNVYTISIKLKKTDYVFPNKLIYWVTHQNFFGTNDMLISQRMYMKRLQQMFAQRVKFSLKAWLHQALAMCLYLFTIYMDKLTKEIHIEVPWYMLLAYKIILSELMRLEKV